ncbi:MAG: SMI1/KNR4 family protein [Acetatifactor sp.]|nr:SMI1/KNR4 family protein [Acetatifactor sp.]
MLAGDIRTLPAPRLFRRGGLASGHSVYNGGYPEKPVFTDKNENTYIVDWFIPVSGGKERSVENTLRLLREDEAIPDWLIPFADEDGGSLFCFSVREADYGAIYYYDHEFEYGENPEEQFL